MARAEIRTVFYTALLCFYKIFFYVLLLKTKFAALLALFVFAGLPYKIITAILYVMKCIISLFLTCVCVQNATFFCLVCILFFYLVFNLFIYFFWGSVGVRGVFFINAVTIVILIIQLICFIIKILVTGVKYTFLFGDFLLHDDFITSFAMHLDLLSALGAVTVLVLTALVLTFGVEYLSREAFMYNVIVILCAFSSSIVWFILTYDFGMLLVFWELAGFFSLLLVDTFYSRVRTTQAVTRTFTIGRFSDYALLLGVSEVLAIFENDSLATVFANILNLYGASSTGTAYLFETTSVAVLLFCFFVAAACKCAQFLLFVWLPDAMEAPTPASALIHSSTLVVMGVFMLLRLMPLFNNSTCLLNLFSVVGALTVAYGAMFSAQTSDLKKAVAYSTISQVGYLFCGCGLCAVSETIIYLLVHAICKAMLFIFVGYVVHLFGGTTSIRKMGGLFYILPDMTLYVMILCCILSGMPYTIGFFAKELLVAKFLSWNSVMSCVIIFCWTVAFLCTPIYLFRICVLPFFGRPRATWYRFKNIMFVKTRENYFSLRNWNIGVGTKSGVDRRSLFFFLDSIKHTLITSRFTMLLHCIILLHILFLGEFLLLTLTGFFNGATQFTSISSGSFVLTFVAVLSLSNVFMYQAQLLILILFFTVLFYFYTDIKFFGKNRFKYLIILMLIILFVCLYVVACTMLSTLL